MNHSFLLFWILAIGIGGCGNLTGNDSGDKSPAKKVTWYLKTLHEKQVSGDSLNLSFDLSSNKLSGFTGCNRLIGYYSIKTGKLEISPAASTRYICFGKGTTEKDYLNCLVKSDSIFITNDTLKLFHDATPTAIFASR